MRSRSNWKLWFILPQRPTGGRLHQPSAKTCWLITTVRSQSQLCQEEAMRDAIASVLMEPDFLYRLDMADGFVNTSVQSWSSAGHRQPSPRNLYRAMRWQAA